MQKVNWVNALGIPAFHVVACYTLVRAFTHGFSLWAWVSLGMMWVVSGIGISVGYHRLLSHQAFSCPEWLEKVLYWAAATTFQRSTVWWGNIHRQHHAFTDRRGDPHTPEKYPGFRGFLWSHIGWLFLDVIPPYALQKVEMSRAARWQKRYYLPLAVSGFVPPFLLAGWDGVLVGGFLRIIVLWHITWCTNSVCHMFGDHAHTMGDPEQVIPTKSARNFPMWCLFNLFAILSWGEWWHANHHAKQRSARLGWRWYEFDPGWWVIRLFHSAGIVQLRTIA